MSPATLRRYRAERMLERDFRTLRAGVVATVRARLRTAGATLDVAELDACYASAWSGLYAAALAGEEIANPRAWLVLVTYRRAIEELRAPRRREQALDPNAGGVDDLDGELDDRDRLRTLLQGMRAQLGLREREAAALCYLHGYSRGEAAQLMGLSATRMRKLMEGSKGRAGVSAKVGELAQTISDGSFCEQQASLMRALAFGVLDPDGERYRLAVAHRRDCPACRRYVATLRGAAVVLPPVLTLPGAGARALLGLGGVARHLAGGPAPSSIPSIGASAATGGGSAAGGWALGGAGLGAKLAAAGCLLAVGIGAGCVAIEHHGRAPHRASAPLAEAILPARPLGELAATEALRRPVAPPSRSRVRTREIAAGARGHLRAGNLGREFSIERAAAPLPAAARPAVRASAADAGSRPAAPGTQPAAGETTAAAREFSPG